MHVLAKLPKRVMLGVVAIARVCARMSSKQRLAICQINRAPLLSDLYNWFETARRAGRSPTAEAISYALNRSRGVATTRAPPR